MGVDAILSNIAHTGSTLTIAWYASGGGWQGSTDESWAIDYVEVILKGTTPIPLPGTLLLLGSGLATLRLRRLFSRR